MNHDEELALLCIRDFNICRTQTKHFYDLELKGGWTLQPLKANPARVKLFKELVEWCRARQLEPRLWVYGLFKARAWRFPPKAEAGHLMSENLIPKYRALKGLGFYRHLVHSSIKEKTKELDPNLDVIYATEQVKRRLSAQDPEKCIDLTMTKTLGFHPKSKVCQSCPSRTECAINLQSLMSFDVIGARRDHKQAQDAPS